MSSLIGICFVHIGSSRLRSSSRFRIPPHSSYVALSVEFAHLMLLLNNTFGVAAYRGMSLFVCYDAEN
jgi:hypothetical protein